MIEVRLYSNVYLNAICLLSPHTLYTCGPIQLHYSREQYYISSGCAKTFDCFNPSEGAIVSGQDPEYQSCP